MINIVNSKISKNRDILKLIASISSAILMTFSSIEGKASEKQNGSSVNRAIETSYYTDNNDISNSMVIASEQNIKFLEDRVKSFSFFDIKIVSRSEFEGLHGDFLQKCGEGSLISGDTISHILYLPKILYIGDLPNIIKKINNLTFGETLPYNASYIEIQKNIESAMVYILSLKTNENKKTIQKEINKYYKLYQEFFPGENPNIDTINVDANIDKGTYYFRNGVLKEVKDIKNKYPAIDADFLIKKVDKVVVDNIYQHFYESFFENGAEMLSNIGTLKKDIGLEKMKSDLEKVRKSGDKFIISKKEKDILNIIMESVHKFGFISDNIYKPVFETSIPSEIIKTKEITCVGFSILANNLLSDLGIKYNILYSPGHSLVNVELSNGYKYLFDLLEYDNIIKYNEIKQLGGWKEISYNIKGKNIKTKIIVGTNQEKMLLAQILLNKKNAIGGYDKKSLLEHIYILNRATKLSNQIPDVYYTLAYSQLKLGIYDDALISINNALKLSPTDQTSRLLKANICLNLNDYDGYNYANSMYEKLSK